MKIIWSLVSLPHRGHRCSQSPRSHHLALWFPFPNAVFKDQHHHASDLRQKVWGNNSVHHNKGYSCRGGTCKCSTLLLFWAHYVDRFSGFRRFSYRFKFDILIFCIFIHLLSQFIFVLSTYESAVFAYHIYSSTR